MLKDFEYQEKPCEHCGRTMRRTRIPGISYLVRFHAVPACKPFMDSLEPGTEMQTEGNPGFITRISDSQGTNAVRVLDEKQILVEVEGQVINTECPKCRKKLRVSCGEENGEIGLIIEHEKPKCDYTLEDMHPFFESIANRLKKINDKLEG